MSQKLGVMKGTKAISHFFDILKEKTYSGVGGADGWTLGEKI